MTELDNSITKNLLSYQIKHVINLIEILQNNRTAMDGSDTGTGKTYSAMAVCKHLNLMPIIICPKTIMSNWLRVAKIFEVEPFFIVNYETLRLCKYYVNKKRIKCEYIKKNRIYISPKKYYYDYVWFVPDNVIFIFDEAHRCSRSSLNGQILIAAKKTNQHILILSATIADNPQKFLIFTYILNFIEFTPEEITSGNINLVKYYQIIYKWMMRAKVPLLRIHSELYPKKASRISIKDLGNLFPDTQITADAYTVNYKTELEIQKQYKIIARALDKWESRKRDDYKNKQNKKNPFVVILRARQKIELLKVSIFFELAKDFLANGYSVVIFVNFTETLKTLAKLLDTDCLIHGSQTLDERNSNIDKFMDNSKKIIICNIQAGSVGISLHDLHGGHPRVSIISPTWNSIDLLQALGRIHRAGAKSKSLQRIVYVANTIEERVAKKVRKKLINISSLNDGDLHPIYSLDVLKN